MSGFTVDISGDFEGKLNNLTNEVKAIVEDELYGFGIETVAMAKELCPVDFGFLRNGITFDKLVPPEIGIQIISAMNYSAYIEFGTGVFAAAYVPSLPIEIQEYALTFYVNGKGRIPARPFLFPAIEAGRIKLIETLKRELNA